MRSRGRAGTVVGVPALRRMTDAVRDAHADRLLLAAGLVTLAVSLITFAALGDELVAPGASLVAAVAGAVAVAFARRRPVGALVGFCLVQAACVLLGSRTDQQNWALLIPYFLLPVAWAANTSSRTFWRTAPVVAVLLPLADVLNAPGSAAASVTFILIVPFGLGAAGGRLMHWHEAAQARLRDQAAELEANRHARTAAAVTAERQRIAHELHDLIAHEVSVMVVQAQAAEVQVRAGRPEAAHAIEAVETTGRAALSEMRRLLGVLRQGDEDLALRPQPSLRRIEADMAQMRERGVELALDVEGPPVALPPAVDVAAYRILSEALRSAVEHGGARRARAHVVRAPDALRLTLEADGATSPSVLAGLRERATLFGGALEREPHAGDPGGVLRVRLPLGHVEVLA